MLDRIVGWTRARVPDVGINRKPSVRIGVREDGMARGRFSPRSDAAWDDLGQTLAGQGRL
jgi:hypothetical protein